MNLERAAAITGFIAAILCLVLSSVAARSRKRADSATRAGAGGW